jgi:enediyne biosynthesis protein E4
MSPRHIRTARSARAQGQPIRSTCLTLIDSLIPQRFLFLLALSLCCGSLVASARVSLRQKSSSQIKFVDITSSAGIRWNLSTLTQGPKSLIETMGGGGGFIDYDGDGRLDIYLVCYSQASQPTGAAYLRDVLYRNNGDGTFSDVTDAAGISVSMRGMGLVVGDFNNDGWPDIYVTGYGAGILYRNNGNKTFTNVTERAGVNNNLWGTSAAFLDYDNDGFLDLYVCNYLTYDEQNLPCSFYDGKPYCLIQNFKGSSSRLYHNNRDGTFTDVSDQARISNATGKGLGVIALDYDNDGLVDIFQANDAAQNFLFHNNGNGTFSERALAAGVAFDPNGNARGGMGVDAEDLDGDGYLEIFVANFSGQTNALFHNDQDGLFTETTNKLGLGTISLPMSGFGSRFFDYNNDGLVDLFVLNGHPFEPINKLFPDTTYAEPPFLFENTGSAFREVAAEHGMALKKQYSGRGLALGDFDNDGDSDLLLMNVGQPPALLRNDGGNTNHWLGIRLEGTRSNRDGIGAKVELTIGATNRVKQRLGGTSYCSASDPRLLFGLGTIRIIDQVKVRWPSGATSTVKNVAANQYLTIKEAATVNLRRRSPTPQ